MLFYIIQNLELERASMRTRVPEEIRSAERRRRIVRVARRVVRGERWTGDDFRRSRKHPRFVCSLVSHGRTAATDVRCTIRACVCVCVYTRRRRPVVEGQAQSGRAAVSGSKFNERTPRPSARGVTRNARNARARAQRRLRMRGWMTCTHTCCTHIHRDKRAGGRRAYGRAFCISLPGEWGGPYARPGIDQSARSSSSAARVATRKRICRSCLWVNATSLRSSLRLASFFRSIYRARPPQHLLRRSEILVFADYTLPRGEANGA